jgi:hypothetical protein
MMNMYNGNVVTDADGRAIVNLPNYFEDLNMDFRYQLTVVGKFAQAIIEEEISDNQFVIATSEPKVKVSWMVTGIRKDPLAQDRQLGTERIKNDKERGYYVYPEGYGFGKEKSINHEDHQRATEIAKAGGGE